jgi:tRNA-dihydrouridine synthase B
MNPAAQEPPSSPYPDGAVIMAPLSGFTDLPFRSACRRHGCAFAFTPLVDSGCIVHGRRWDDPALTRGRDEPWLGVQLLGASPADLGEAAAVLNDGAFDILDFNMGCPMPKVTKRGAGAALGAEPGLAVKCLEALVSRSRFGVTAKMRPLDEADPEPTVTLALALEGVGIRALTIHGRIWSRIYAGPVATGVIHAVSESLAIPVVANGGVVDRESAGRLRAETGCGRIMVARGAVGNPWIFRELLDPAALPPTHEEVVDEMARHVMGMIDLYGERDGAVRARKIILAYMAGRGYRGARREAAKSIRTRKDGEAFLKELRREGPSRRFSGSRSCPRSAAAPRTGRRRERRVRPHPRLGLPPQAGAPRFPRRALPRGAERGGGEAFRA